MTSGHPQFSDLEPLIDLLVEAVLKDLREDGAPMETVPTENSDGD